MAKKQLGYTETDKKENFAKFYTTTFSDIPNAAKQALANPLAWDALPDIAQAIDLEKAGYMTVENGYTVHQDGSSKVAVKTDMPYVTPPMWDWWFAWHGCQDSRYKLWHPNAHLSAQWQDGRNDNCYIGRNSIIKEYIGENLLDASIQFKSPLEFGFSNQSINHTDQAVYICAKLGHPTLPVDYGYLIHQVRKTENGAEMRSRFWVGGQYVSLRQKGKIADAVVTVLKHFKSLPKNFAQDLLRHCAEEMNHLAAFLPDLYQAFHQSGELHISGAVHAKNDERFEQTMFGFLYNQQRFGRMPDMILEPHTVEDVIAIVRYAKQNGKKVTVLSGGRSFSANAMRNNCLAISMKHFQQYTLNKDELTATAEPGIGGSDLMKVLYKNELFFPAGHCKGVCLGGYLLQGGYGWNGRKLGIACKSVLGLDIVTADGELIHANETQNSDMYWAARGSGAGFFGVVVKFYLQLYPKPKYQAIIAHDFSMKYLEEVYRWAYEVGPSIPKSVEFQMMMSRNMMNIMGPGIEAFAPIFADTKEEFEEAKQFMENSPIKNKAIIRTPAFNLGIDIFYKGVMEHYPANYNYGVDNMWTHASIDDLLPYIKEIAETLPPAPSHFLWLNWYPDAIDTDMAYSKEDNIYMALYSCWKDKKDTPLYTNWASDMVRKMQHFSSGIQLADEGLHKRADKFMSDENFKKIQAIRDKRDPNRLFMEWHSHGFTK
jgi:FAD/FMN-containing dehydrogenase